ncbi:MAG: glycosyltransferase, partial [Candidatus Eisenbacteria bacterium]|nr:glycosyltransferase [Candidatus Eisenbacteria bacterium]
MRVLVANKFWYRRAGLERVMFDEIRWLEEAGHEVAHFSTTHPENDPSPWSGYFAPYVEIGAGAALTLSDKARAARGMFWNREAAVRFSEVVAQFRPHVVHVHGVHRHLSPSILFAAKQASVPVVQSLHDYHPICPADDLLRGGTTACEPPRCRRSNVLPCALYRCVQGSTLKSALAGSELLWRRWVTRIESLVDAFISPSQYLADVVSAGGISQRPVHILPNAIPAATIPAGATIGDSFVYAGRLSREKGVRTLLRAVERADVSLTVAGEGPLRASLEAAAPPRVRFLGRLSGDEVNRLLAGCRAAVVPSEWAENAPMAVLEPMVLGRP